MGVFAHELLNNWRSKIIGWSLSVYDLSIIMGFIKQLFITSLLLITKWEFDLCVCSTLQESPAEKKGDTDHFFYKGFVTDSDGCT